MTAYHPPSRLPAAVGRLAAHMGDSEALRRTIAKVAAEEFGLQGAQLAGVPPTDQRARVPVWPERNCWLCYDANGPGPAPDETVQAYAAVAGVLLRQAARSEAATEQYTTLLARLEELKRDLDNVHKTDWIAAERARIAQDLHDRVAQTLFSLGLTADWLLAHVDEGEPLWPEIDRLKKMAGTALAQVREAIFSLSSPPVEPTQFRAAVHSLLLDLEQAGIAGDLRLWGDLQQLSPQVTDGLYQVIREALVNVRRHAKATHLLVSVRTLADRVVAVIQDDGQGIAPEVLDTYRKNGAHWGLRGMESRVERLGGTLTLAPGDECGLIVTAAIPLRGAE